MLRSANETSVPAPITSFCLGGIVLTAIGDSHGVYPEQCIAQYGFAGLSSD